MSDEPPTLSTYEEMTGVEFELDDEDLERNAINTELERLFDN